MKIAKRYLDEIEEILKHGGKRGYPDAVCIHWCNTASFAGLFWFCSPGGDTHDGRCGCLTIIRAGRREVFDRSGSPSNRLTAAIRTDSRLHESSGRIGELLAAAKSDDERRQILYPYGEWQTKLRLEYQDVPESELELIEV